LYSKVFNPQVGVNIVEQRSEVSEITVNVAGAHPKHTLMMWSSAGRNYVVATAATGNGKEITGHLTQATQAAGKATLRMLNAPGTAIGLAEGAITEGDEVTAAAGGKVEANGAGVKLGVALETVTDDEAIEYRPFLLADRA